MKIMCDTNVIIDVLLEREPFAENSCKVLSLCEEHKIDGFVSASSVTDIYYLVRKYTHSTDLAYKAIGKMLEIVKVCSVTNNDVLTAFQRRAKDFEDCLVATCAKSIRCDYIVTRNKKDFEEFDIPLLTPAELLHQLSSPSYQPHSLTDKPISESKKISNNPQCKNSSIGHNNPVNKTMFTNEASNTQDKGGN